MVSARWRAKSCHSFGFQMWLLLKITTELFKHLIPGPHLQRSLHWSGVGPRSVQVIPLEAGVEHPCRTAISHVAREPPLPCSESGWGLDSEPLSPCSPRPSCLSGTGPPPAIHLQASLGHVSLVRPWTQGGAVQELPKSSPCGPHGRARGSEKKIRKQALTWRKSDTFNAHGESSDQHTVYTY